jgi:hypothetical protein
MRSDICAHLKNILIYSFGFQLPSKRIKNEQLTFNPETVLLSKKHTHHAPLFSSPAALANTHC